jgi:hypothetical protein
MSTGRSIGPSSCWPSSETALRERAQVDGAGYFHDAVTSTAVAHKVTAWGLNVVVLALRISSPCGGEPLAR